MTAFISRLSAIGTTAVATRKALASIMPRTTTNNVPGWTRRLKTCQFISPLSPQKTRGMAGNHEKGWRRAGSFQVPQINDLIADNRKMREEGLEPSRLAAQEPKSCASASSATLANLISQGLTPILSSTSISGGRMTILVALDAVHQSVTDGRLVQLHVIPSYGHGRVAEGNGSLVIAGFNRANSTDFGGNRTIF
jgi:hypothetical protein